MSMDKYPILAGDKFVSKTGNNWFTVIRFDGAVLRYKWSYEDNVIDFEYSTSNDTKDYKKRIHEMYNRIPGKEHNIKRLLSKIDG